MIARIKLSDGSSYDRVVFYAEFDREKSKVLVFDEKTEKLEYVYLYTIGSDLRISQNLIIINWDTDGMKVTDERYWFDFIEGFEETIEKLPIETYNKCKELQTGLFVKEWNEITDESSVRDLIFTAGGFHDGRIDEIQTGERYTFIKIPIWGGQVHLRVKNPEFSPRFMDDYMYDANIFFENGRIYFVDKYSVKCCGDMDDFCNWMSCDKMEWKITLDKGAV